eukprot:TRINITY_DN2286_c0_g1_i2.p1 TRINITY_DN2286_c0_g1~~TRINITY_DN2286_c0_g1_i2.p1  ORF type:complete len:201 (-),score=42.55 TRINITY_DN2286_c0_g1_i2:45-647(-)
MSVCEAILSYLQRSIQMVVSEYVTDNQPVDDKCQAVMLVADALVRVFNTGRKDELILNTSFWDIFVEIQHKLPLVLRKEMEWIEQDNDEDLEKGIAFIRFSLSRKVLKQSCSVLMDDKLVEEYYQTDSILRHESHKTIFLEQLNSLELIPFNISVNEEEEPVMNVAPATSPVKSKRRKTKRIAIIEDIKPKKLKLLLDDD